LWKLPLWKNEKTCFPTAAWKRQHLHVIFCCGAGRVTSAKKIFLRFRIFLLGSVYERLTRDDGLRPADLIIVAAGGMERKQYGLELFHRGVSPKLLLSIGRFEVRKMRNITMEGFDELIQWRERTPLEERHFFFTIDASGVRVEKAKLPQWNTYGEALAFRQFLESEKPRCVIVISTDVHLRRVALTINKLCRGLGTEFFYCPVPSHLAQFTKEDWWAFPQSRFYVFSEMVKLVGYRLILSLPVWAARLIFTAARIPRSLLQYRQF